MVLVAEADNATSQGLEHKSYLGLDFHGTYLFLLLSIHVFMLYMLYLGRV